MEFFETISSEKSGFRVTSNALLMCENANNLQIFKKEKKSAVDAYIKKLNHAFTTDDQKPALAQLLIFLPQCSHNTIVAEAQQWLKLCLQYFNKVTDSAIKSALFVAITYILNRYHGNDNFSSVINFKPLLMKHIYKSSDKSWDVAFECMFEFLRAYRTRVLADKEGMETKVLRALALPLNAESRRVVSSAGRAFASIPMPGKEGSGEQKGVQLAQVISLAHVAADALFKGVQENEEYKYPRDYKLPIKIIRSAIELKEPIQTLLIAASVAGNSFVFIEEFLKHSCSDYVKICPKDLIQLAFRVLQVESGQLRGSSSLECVTLEFILPSLHAYALRFLSALVANNICNHFVSLVEEQVVATLKSTNQKTSKDKDGKVNKTSVKANLSIRIQCYETLAQIVQVTKNCHKGTSEELVPCLLADIMPTRDSIALRSAKARGGRLSLMVAKKKSKKKGYSIDSSEANQSSGKGGCDVTDDGTKREIAVAVAALGLIQKMFLFAQDSLGLQVVRTLTKSVTRLLECRPEGVYAHPETRASLYAAGVAGALCPHPLCPPSYIVLGHALREGAREGHPMVSSICTKGLASLSFVMANPGVATLAQMHRGYSATKEATNVDEDDNMSADEGSVEENGVGEDENDENEEEGEQDKNDDQEADVQEDEIDMEEGNNEEQDGNNREDENEENDDEEEESDEDGNETDRDEDEPKKIADKNKKKKEKNADSDESDVSESESESATKANSQKKKATIENQVIDIGSSSDESGNESDLNIIEVVSEKVVDSNEKEDEVHVPRESESEDSNLVIDLEQKENESEVQDKNVSKKRKTTEDKSKAVKKSKGSGEKKDTNSLTDMLSTFVDADPDSDSD